MKRWEIDRRRFLRGAGACIGLPLLEQMMPSVARAQIAGAPPPRRLVSMFIACGVNNDTWFPKTTGSAYTLPAGLAPLAPVQSDLLVLSNVANRPAKASTAGEHPAGTGAFLTCAPPLAGGGLGGGISVDQIAANALKKYTLIPSLELGPPSMQGATGDCQGYSCTYMYNISWVSPMTPAAREVSPQVVFDKLFAARGTTGASTAADRRKKYRTSVMDAVQADAADLNSRLGATDKQKVDEYLTAVREVERQVQALSTGSGVCSFPAKPTVTSADIPAYTKAMLDLIALAFQCDMTRVATLMIKAGGDRNDYAFPWLNIADTHHPLSHHDGDATKLGKLTQIDAWHASQFAYLMQKLKALSEPDGSVLDNTVMFMSSEISDGNRHDHVNLPLIVGGRGGGKIHPGSHVRFATEMPMANVYRTMLDAVGAPVASFGDSTGLAPL